MLGVYSGLHTSGLDDCANATCTPMMANEIVNSIIIRRCCIITHVKQQGTTRRADRKLQIKIGRKAPNPIDARRFATKMAGREENRHYCGKKKWHHHTLFLYARAPTDLSQQYDIIKRCIIEKESRHQRRFHHRI